MSFPGRRQMGFVSPLPVFLYGVIPGINSKVAEWVWQSASGSWSATVAGSESSLLLVWDPSSSSPLPVPRGVEKERDSESSPHPRAPMVLLIEDNASDVYVIHQVLNGC